MKLHYCDRVFSAVSPRPSSENKVQLCFAMHHFQCVSAGAWQYKAKEFKGKLPFTLTLDKVQKVNKKNQNDL